MTATLSAPSAETLEAAYENTTTLDRVTTATPDAPMTGADLLNFVKKAGSGMTKSELAIATGYYSNDKDGKVRANLTRMQEACLSALDVNLGKNVGASRGKGGRKLSYTARVQGNKNLLVGNAYTAMLDLKPGDEFKIKLSKNSGIIRLVPVGSDEETTEE